MSFVKKLSCHLSACLNSENKEAVMLNADVLIVGTGVAGLYCALSLPLSCNIIMISKSAFEDCDSYLAQGGICMLRNDEDYARYFEDTMHAGHYENDEKSVNIMIRSSQELIKHLICYGVDFERNEDNSLKFTKEAAHSVPRILFHEDITGEAITSVLLQVVKRMPNVILLDHVTMVDILTGEDDAGIRHCNGAVVRAPKGTDVAAKYGVFCTKDERESLFTISAKNVVWACGGIGGLFDHSTNFAQLTGDALGIALKHGIALQNPDYIQVHPTTLYTEKKGRAFLISESVRGAGGILLNEAGERFVDELLPRDIVSGAIMEEMKKTATDHVWLSMERIPKDIITSHFRHICDKCLEEGYDCTNEPIPVVPAQHYFMGGVKTDYDGKTSMTCLYAAGETACNGVHGANRLASNSLLESMVFANRVAESIKSETENLKIHEADLCNVDWNTYADSERLAKEYKNSIFDEIERARNEHE